MGLLEQQRRRRAIRSYVRELPALLLRDYGAGRWYSAQQVRGTVERSRLSLEHLPYALLMFSDQAEFERHCRDAGTMFDVAAMRHETGPASFYDTMQAAQAGLGSGETHSPAYDGGHSGGSHG